MASFDGISPLAPSFTDDDVKNYNQLSIRDDTFFYVDGPDEFLTDKMLQYSVRDNVGMDEEALAPASPSPFIPDVPTYY